MKKENKWELILMIVFLIVAIACAVFIMIFANDMFLNGTQARPVWSLVLLGIGFVVSFTMFSMLFSSYRFDKKQALKNEELQAQMQNTNETKEQ